MARIPKNIEDKDIIFNNDISNNNSNNNNNNSSNSYNNNNNNNIEDDMDNNKSPTATPENEPYIPNYDYINKAKITTIIFKTPTGTPLKGEFSVTDKLKHVRDYFIANCPIDKSFHMMTVYPKHYFSNSDFNKTLLDLELVPSATIIIGLTEDEDSKDNSNSGSESNSGYGLYSYFSSVKDYVSSFFTYSPSNNNSSNNNNNNSYNREYDDNSSNNRHLDSTNSNSNSRNPIKKRTGIHSLSDSNDDKKNNGDNGSKKDTDSNSYYNGNSTQFNG